MKHIRHEFWWQCEKIAGHIWQQFCPKNEASYWLDFLPAFCARRCYKAQNNIVKGKVQ